MQQADICYVIRRNNINLFDLEFYNNHDLTTALCQGRNNYIAYRPITWNIIMFGIDG